jgi:hypothetical protein
MTVNLASYVVTQTIHPVWGKLPAILEAFRRYPQAEWIWWLDIDSIIMNPEIDLFEHLLDPSILQTKLVSGYPILVLNREQVPSNSGLFTTVQFPPKPKL